MIEDITKADQHQSFCQYSLLIIKDSHTAAGYVKLQIVDKDKPLTTKHFPLHHSIRKHVCIDRYKRVCLTNFIDDDIGPLLSRQKNKPAATFGSHIRVGIDTVLCYRSTKWPTEAEEWLSRHRHNDWPTPDMITELKYMGYFVVKKGHPSSSEIDLEWRISLTLQERKLVFNFSDVQHKCYVVLKMINRDIIYDKEHEECITTYHWKTCLFYVIEENKRDVWEKNLFFHCIGLCIWKMLAWVIVDFCPNYFIPKENLFDGKLNNSLRNSLIIKLVKLLYDGPNFLFDIKSNNLGDYFSSRGSPEEIQSLQAKSEKLYQEMLYSIIALPVGFTMNSFSQYLVNNKHSNLIETLWSMVRRIEKADPISDYSANETRRAICILAPFIYTSLASNISVMSMSTWQSSLGNFLLFGSYTYFIKGGLMGYLKLISVLYAFGCYADCAWYLDHCDEEFIKNNPSICSCLFPSEITFMSTKHLNCLQNEIYTCVFFLKTELQIIPDALKYEIFKGLGISLDESETKQLHRAWHFAAVVDSNILYFLLNFLIKRKLRGVNFSKDAMHDINQIKDALSRVNVRHRPVAYNVKAWMLSTVGLTSRALDNLNKSWKEMYSLDLSYLIEAQEMKQKIYHFNSAKLHALVIVYNALLQGNQPSSDFA